MRRVFCVLPLVVIGLASTAQVSAESATVRTACLQPCEPLPDIEVHYRVPSSNITSGTQTFDFGSTPVGTSVSYDNFAIGATENFGPLTISSITLPAGFTYVQGPPIAPDPVAAGASHLTRIKCDATAPGTYTGNLTISSDDPDEGTFTIALTCTVTGPTVQPTTQPTTAPTAPPVTADQGGEENGTATTGGEGSGAGLPAAGSSSLQTILLGLGLLLVGSSAGLLARRRSS